MWTHAGRADDREEALAAFSDLYRATYPAVLAFLRRRADPQDAEDLTAEVYAAAWDGWHRAPVDQERLWLFGIARNLLANDRRAAGRRRRLELRVADELDPARDETGATDASLDLRRAWARLAEPDREVLALVAWDGLTGQEAAVVLGCTRAAFSVRLTRARRRLRRLVEGGPVLPPPPLAGRPAVSRGGSAS